MCCYIKITKPKVITSDDDKLLISSDVAFPDGQIKELWYKISKHVEKYLIPDNADAFLVAILPIAMQNSWNIQIDANVSQKLLFNVNNKVIPVLSKYSKIYNKIFVETNGISIPTEESGNFVGTGLSCGVDSFDAVFSGLSYNAPFKLNSVTFFNVGQHRSTAGLNPEESRLLFNKRKMNTEKCAEELNLPLIEVDSNLGEFLSLKYSVVHQFCNFSAVLACGRFFSRYYYASGIELKNFSILNCDKDSAYYETFLSSMLSTDNVSFYIEGSERSRLEKIKNISLFSIAQKYLNVCFNESENCGLCEKCIRTQLELFSIGCLNSFNKVFDIEVFNKNKNNFLLFSLKRKTNSTYSEILNEINKNNISIPYYIIFFGLFYSFKLTIKRMLKTLFKK